MATVTWALRLMGAVVMIPFGLDQLLRSKDWTEFVPSWIQPLMPGWPEGFMRTHAVGNLIIGAWLISGVLTKAAAGVAVIWLATIAAGSLLTGRWQIALRDLAVTLGLLALFLAV